ncbi:MAG: hypothetical protein M1838_003956 [Thelocarpon superellum]|nr:MAG: hypothetical protein M1838_003956 [Thelocarpon superellum]
MSASQTLFAVAVAVAAVLSPVSAQTSSKCNPLTSSSCPPDPALGKSATIDFTQGASDMFTSTGNPTYDSNGASFTIAKSGDAPTILSKFYIMFGNVEVSLKAAPGVGIVSSSVLESDDLDEIDWEWLGADASQVQSNYFGKGQTGSYNRGAFHADPDNQSGFKTYAVDWTADQIEWQIDGSTVRTLTSAAAAGQYPQTPMQIKIGAWSGGDSSNAPGTIQWAGGSTNYAAGPYTMQVKSIKVTDYSTGTQYTYGGTDGTWQSVQAAGGKVNPSGSGSDAPPTEASASAAPAITSASPSIPFPFSGNHLDTTSTFSTPSIYPWVSQASSASAGTATTTALPGLPSGWTVSSSGKVQPPSSATLPSTSLPAGSWSSWPVSSAYGAAAAEGAPSAAPASPQGGANGPAYNTPSFPITNAPYAPEPTGMAAPAPATTLSTAYADQAGSNTTVSPSSSPIMVTTSGVSRGQADRAFLVAIGLTVGALLLL